jgi:hypothetical protein
VRKYTGAVRARRSCDAPCAVLAGNCDPQRRRSQLWSKADIAVSLYTLAAGRFTLLQIRGALSLSLYIYMVPRRHAALSWPAVPGLRPCRRRGRCVRPWPGRREPPQRRGAAPRARGCETVPPRPPPPPAEQPTAGRPGLTTSRSALLLTFLLIKEHRTTQVEFEKNIGVQMHFSLLSEIVLTVGCAKFEFVQGMRNFLKLCRVHGRVGPRGPQPRAARPRACVGSARHGPSWSRGPPPQPRAFKLCF